MARPRAATAVELRPVVRGDAEALIRAHRASVALHHPWVRPFLDMDGFQRWFARFSGGDCASLVAREQAGAAIVGVFNFSQIFMGGFCSAYLGYYACVPCAGRGLMGQALPLATAYAFDTLGLHRIEANIQPDNLRSIALARRAGFRREGYSPRYLRIEGQWRDHERWALLADD